MPAYDGARRRASIPAFADRTALRNAYVVSFRTQPTQHDGLIIPSWDHVGDMMCACLSVLYGKRFDNHGAIEASGFFALPDLRNFDVVHMPTFPHNDGKPRADIGVPLHLGEIRRILPVVNGRIEQSDKAQTFRTASKFYLQALQASEEDIEVAWLHLVTAGEILSQAIELPDNCLIDAATRAVLARLETEMQDGARVARVVRSKLRSVKRRFVLALENLVDASFFERGEAKQPYARLTPAKFLPALSAGYDLRSRYVHTGRSFGPWISPLGPDRNELQVGRPTYEDRTYEKLLAKSPTYIGLERVIRYALLRFAARLGIEIDE